MLFQQYFVVSRLKKKMNIESISSCTLCLCIKYDGVYNGHASKLLQELFPELVMPNVPFSIQIALLTFVAYTTKYNIMQGLFFYVRHVPQYQTMANRK